MNHEINLPVRVAREKRRAADWSLVLTSADIEHDVRPAGTNWVVVVGDDDLETALAVLDAYDNEQRPARAEAPAAIEYGPTYSALWYMAALVVFHLWVEHIGDTTAWKDAGRAYALRIRAGEWWRVVTALTLHSGFIHVLGNAVIGTVFAGALCRAVGPGTGLWIMVLAGGAGNLMNAYLRTATHAAVGASTALFGAFGALAGLQMRTPTQSDVGRSKAWIPLGAALAMLAILGAGEDTDIWAHLLGLLAGIVAGAGAAELRSRLPRRPEAGLVVAGVAAIVACWFLALH